MVFFFWAHELYFVVTDERKTENSPTFQAKQKELEEIENLKEQREEAERVYLNKLWQEKERLAQEEFQLQKEREAMEKERKLEIEVQMDFFSYHTFYFGIFEMKKAQSFSI